MTDETRPEGQPTEGAAAENAAPAENATAPAESATAVAPPPEERPSKLRQTVEIKDVGPCKKHIKVAVDRADIKGRMDDHFKKLVMESTVTGFRPGKAPRKLVEKRFFKEVSDQVKSEVLLASLEQLGEDHDIAPLAPPNIDPDRIEVPEDGPLVYEFEVEVRPEFDLPAYRGMKLRRPTKKFTDEDVADARRRVLLPYGQVVPKENGTVELGDRIVADMSVRDGNTVIGNLQETTLNVERRLAFKDGLIENFADKLHGARVGDSREVEIKLGSTAAGGLAGKTVKGTLTLKDIKTVRLPELSDDFVEKNFGVATSAQLDELIRVTLERNLEHQQRRSARVQIMEQIAASANWQLPEDLLMRNYRRVRSRRIMEMRGDGLTDEQIVQQLRLMEQDLVKSTEMSLKEYFVLQKIAEVEKIDVDEDDLNDEIARIADQTDESPRRVRARLEKEDMMEALMADLIERKALDLILESAEYEDVAIGAEEPTPGEMATVEAQAVPGEMLDPAAAASEPAAPSQEGQ